MQKNVRRGSSFCHRTISFIDGMLFDTTKMFQSMQQEGPAELVIGWDTWFVEIVRNSVDKTTVSCETADGVIILFSVESNDKSQKVNLVDIPIINPISIMSNTSIHSWIAELSTTQSP